MPALNPLWIAYMLLLSLSLIYPEWANRRGYSGGGYDQGYGGGGGGNYGGGGFGGELLSCTILSHKNKDPAFPSEAPEDLCCC